MLGASRAFAVFLWLFQVTNALHFYLETGQSRCFFEELPKDTLVVAKVQALEFDDGINDFVKNRNLKLEFTVDVCILLAKFLSRTNKFRKRLITITGW